MVAASGGALADLKVVGEGLQKQFGVHTQLLISQFVAFIIFALLLKKFAFGPIQAMLEQRAERIAAGEDKLKLIEQQLAESEATKTATLAKANDEALRIIHEAKEGAIAFAEQKSQEAIAQAQQIISKAEAAGNADRERISAELKKEFGRLLVSSTSQVTGKVLNDEDQRRINEEALSKVG